MLHQFYVLTRDLHYITVGRWIAHNNIQHELHLNRMRFWIPEGPLLTEFLLRWADSCPQVDQSLDLVTGQP
jgi:hypothetical protein